MTPKAQATKAQLGKWADSKLKSMGTATEVIIRIKRQPMGENICKPYT